MEYGLSGPFAVVGHHSKVTESQLLCNGANFDEEVTEEGVIVGGCIREFGDRLFGDKQDVGGGLGVDVAECKAKVVFIDDVGGNLAVDDFCKKGVAHG